MAGFDLINFLFGDPTQPGGTWVQNLLGGAPNPPATSSSGAYSGQGRGWAPGQTTPPAPALAGPGAGPMNLAAFFRPQTGLFGNSIIGSALMGGLAGLAGSTGYKGLAALGQGAMSAVDAARQRQATQIAPLQAWQNMQRGQQQIQLGQQQLVAGNLGNIWALQRVNLYRAHFGLQPVSLADITAHPELINDPVGAGAAATAPQPQPTAPAQSNQGVIATVPPQAPITVSSLDPAAASPAPAQAFTPAPQTLAQSDQMPAPTVVPGNAAAAAGHMPAMPTTASPPSAAPAPNVMASNTLPATPNLAPTPVAQSGVDQVVAAYQSAAQSAYEMGDIQKGDEMMAKAAEYANQAGQAGRVKTSELAATENAPQTQREAVTKISQDYNNNPAVKTMYEVRPAFQSAAAAYNRKDLPSDADLTYAVLKLWNPGGGNLRPSTLEQVDEIKGLPAYIKKGLQAVLGGQGLTAEMRDALWESAKGHFGSYLKDYNAAVRSYRAQAKLLPNAGSVQEQQWRSDYTAPIPPAAIQKLRQMPSTAGQFDEIFGQGAADEALLSGGD
jgi:hypothetical protein